MHVANLIILFNLIYSVTGLQNVCYQGNLKFGDEPCLRNTLKEIPADVLEGKIHCKEIACMPYLKSFEAHICFQQKVTEIKYIILYNDGKKKSFEIPVFEEKESYMLKRVAISGTTPTNSHITLRLISGELAYRLAFNYKDLGVKNDHILAQRLGPNNRVFWQPFIKYDKYFIIDYENGDFSENFEEYHNNSVQNYPPHDEEVSSSKESTIECSDWSNAISEKTTTALVPPTAEIIPTEGTNESNILIYLIIAIIFIILLFCYATIALPVFCYLNQKKKSFALNDVAVVNDSKVASLEQQQQHTAIQVLIEPPLPELPSRNFNEEIRNANVAPIEQPQISQLLPQPFSQLPNSMITPPPSYRTNESVQAFSHVLMGFVHYMNNTLGIRNNLNIQRPSDIVEMQALTRQSHNDLAFV
uniref:Uncharacterized protein n=1 Tax=Panagrolaimus sp. PS1159 TaxID=55785 RepID=A0AC35GPX1_9BILA